MFEEFEDLSRADLLKILAIIILSDGTMRNTNTKYIRLLTSSRNNCQHEFFKFLCFKLFYKEPRKCFVNSLDSEGKSHRYIQSTLVLYEAVFELLRLCQSYKTTPGLTKKQDFLKEIQPSCSFLFNSSKKARLLALRTWFDFDGSISPYFKLKKKRDIKKGKFYDYYQVQFECEIKIAETNPFLLEDLIKLCSGIGFSAIKKKKTNWSGLDGICISRLDDVKRFILYGPITEVKISKKSNRFEDISKKKICLAVKKILDDPSISKSKYFKKEEDAINYKKMMDDTLFKIVSKC